MDKARRTLAVTWLKPADEARWWEHRWQPWLLRMRSKSGRAALRPWVTAGVECDTVQVTGGMLQPRLSVPDHATSLPAGSEYGGVAEARSTPATLSSLSTPCLAACMQAAACGAQWGTMLAPDGTFALADQGTLRMEVARIEENLP